MPRLKETYTAKELEILQSKNLLAILNSEQFKPIRHTRKFLKPFHELELERLESIGYSYTQNYEPVEKVKGFAEAMRLAEIAIEALWHDYFSSDETSKHRHQDILVAFNKAKAALIEAELIRAGIYAKRRSVCRVAYRDPNDPAKPLDTFYTTYFRKKGHAKEAKDKPPERIISDTRLENIAIKTLKTSYHQYYCPYAPIVFNHLSLNQAIILACNFHNFFEVQKLNPLPEGL